MIYLQHYTDIITHLLYYSAKNIDLLIVRTQSPTISYTELQERTLVMQFGISHFYSSQTQNKEFNRCRGT